MLSFLKPEIYKNLKLCKKGFHSNPLVMKDYEKMRHSDLKEMILKRLRINFKDLFFALPDLHGRSDIAQFTVSTLEGLEAENVVFLGDYIDKMDDSYGVVKTLIAAKERNPSWVYLLGNHEDLFLQSCLEGAEPFEANNLYVGRTLEERMEIIRFFKSLKLYYQTSYVLFLHGGVDESFDQPIEKIDKNEILWSYEVNPRYVGAKIVRGHDIVPFPTEAANHISCENGGWLRDNDFCISLIANDGRDKKLCGVLRLRGLKTNQIKLIVNNSVVK